MSPNEEPDATELEVPTGPRYRSITETLRKQLAEGTLAPGVRLPPLLQLARQFNVSTTTVRNAIRVLEHEGSVYHVPAVGTFVRPTYPSRAAADQITIAWATLDIVSPFETAIARGIHQGCHQRAWGLQIYDAQIDPEREATNLARLARSNIQGVIITPLCVPQNVELLFKLKQTGFPMVLLDRSIFGLMVDVVESDHERAGYLATECLLKQGHRKVLAITADTCVSSVQARLRGYERALLDHGLEPARSCRLYVDLAACEIGVATGRRWYHGYAAILPALKELNEPVGVFALDDYTGWGVYEACREVGLRIPEDVSVICVDDTDIARAMVPPMAAVAQRTTEIGRHAVDLLERRMKSINVEPSHVIVDVDLIERPSVGPPGGASAGNASRSAKAMEDLSNA